MVTIDQRFHHELEVFRNETEGCAQFLFALLSVHETLNRDRKVRALLNRAPLFWQTCLGALQTSTFIALGRIFDSDSPYNISKLMRLATDHRSTLFSRAGLERRKMAGKTERPVWLNDYLKTAYEPMPADFRKIRKRVQKWRAIYEANYRDVRHQVFAHKEAADSAEVAVLFSKGNYEELQRMCAFLGSLYSALWELFVNGRKPVLRHAKYSVSRLRSRPQFAGPSIRSIQHDITQDTTAFLNLSGHLKSGHAWSVQNRPCRKAVRDEIVLLCRLLRRQVCFCAPTSRTAFEYVSVVKQAVEHRRDGRTISQQLAPVFHGSVGSQ